MVTTKAGERAMELLVHEATFVSIAIPVLNEKDNIQELKVQLDSLMSELPYQYEIIVSDNGSTDGTREVLQNICQKDPKWKAILLSRNFGHQNSLICALNHSKGDVIVSIDGDLQDPPAVIKEMLEAWSNGADVVNTIRLERPGEPFLRIFLIKLFYAIMDLISNKSIHNNSGDFRLLSRRALNHLLKMKERNIFIRGLIPLIGFNQQVIYYRRNNRHKGFSKMGFFRLMSFALDGLTSTTITPLKIASIVGISSVLISFCLGIWFLYVYFADISEVPGWVTTNLIISFFGGLNLLTLGIIGEYIGRIFLEVKGRPLYIVESYIGNLNSNAEQNDPNRYSKS